MRLMSSRAPQRGASLIEVLVAILIVSMGVIAMGGLLASSSRLGKASESRAIAGLLAADLADRVKANACGLTGQWIDPANASVHCAGIAANPGFYDLKSAFVVGGAAPSDAAACAVANDCTVAELAAIDVAQWRQALFYGLPNGAGYVAYDAAAKAAGGAGAVDVWIAWLDPTALSEGGYQDIDDMNLKTCPPDFRGLSPQPRCMYFRVSL